MNDFAVRGVLKISFMVITRVLFGAAFAGLLTLNADIDLTKLPPAASQKDVTFAKDIKPLFEKTCFKCHGAEKQKGKLRVDSIEAIKKGGDNGEVIVIGKSEKSSLVHAIAALDPDMAMPPEGKADPLTKEQIGLVRAWIDQGAK
jgi:mono/diheme cytochrome c family protein